MSGLRHVFFSGKATSAACLLLLALNVVPELFAQSTDGLAFGDPLTGRVVGRGDRPPEGYVPPLVSNGDLNMLVEWTGGQSDADYFGLSPTVYWQGRRGPAREAELFGFGKFMPTMTVDGADAGRPQVWEQTLDVTQAVVVCEGVFSADIESRVEAFCALDRNVVGLRRRVKNVGSNAHRVVLDLDYRMPGHERMLGDWRNTDVERKYSGKTYGHRVIDFDVRVTSSDRGVIRRTADLNPGESAIAGWFITFSDSYEANRTAVPTCGWEDLFAAHARAWKSYYDESYVRLPDARLQRMYDVQQYHLRCTATRWGFPVGIFPKHWQGKYFGFDEMYMHDGLVSAGHFEIARRCPEWRQAVIPWALRRQSHYGKPGKFGARWMWMSLEDGDVETAGIGFWLDHIFAMGTIAKSAWTQYLYSGDLAYLRRTGYQVIHECARFYRNNWILEDGESAAIGRCTDLERLGPSRDKAFLTTCSAIYALRAAAAASEILKTNLVEAADFRQIAGRLEKGLPTDPSGRRYVAYENCTEESVGTLGGLYPFPLYGKADARQAESARHFIREGRKTGNMYPLGDRVCPWYAAKMSAAMTALGDRVEPCRWLREASGAIGLFGETWEINEPGHWSRPWFATASGCCVFAVNEMLVKGTWPESWRDFAFRLPDGKGGWIEKRFAEGKPLALKEK